MGSITIVLTPEPEGGFTATVPEVPGAVTWGETREEAIEMAKSAVADLRASYLADVRARPEQELVSA